MSKQENQTTKQQTALVADLPVAKSQAGKIKGGPKKIFVGGLSIAPSSTDGRLTGTETEDNKSGRDKG